MELTRYVDELQHQLATAAAAGGDEARELAGRLSAPLDTAVRLVLLEALSTAAAEITAELAPGAVDVRLRGRDPEFVVTPSPTSAFEEDATPPVEPARPAALDPDDVSTSRTTLRLPDQLKALVEEAAAREGVSVNTWLVRAVAAALAPTAPSRPAPRATSTSGRVTGWVR
ncbi:ribbon-helix-helix protein, CopG family [Oerskovia turbata]|uniref:Ribbon-helix-helix protein, CopG family n=1 Tax=Oerskovia turbata TaxID=1713 RepID=A0A4Q1KQ47_9CELL|nr:ribbon-helix-helix protein, CopG family [Oerskovia turbata]RXR26072.1 ribbon-helix-helix protein, CopG family [Oerskovia turbata]RXR31620.1 ribbon-helix-helix protein, CopG family [Oerskovia turbata]TGJ97273.1 ribbon-helix-helix protein, CopG family [Actinotalea fermentans ATCC 43279 = JCM 9966 = DSM 3133]